MVNCNICGKELRRTKSTTGPKNYCSHKCAAVDSNMKSRKHYIDGRRTYRDRAIRHYGERCQNKNCIVSKVLKEIPRHMLDVDHINSKKGGHELDNLQVLCVWCHAHKTRTRNKNNAD